MHEPLRTIEEDAEVHVAEVVDVPPADVVVEDVRVNDGPQDGELLLPAERRDDLRRRWLEVQSSFIDEPQDAVSRADGLVQELLKSVAEGFESARRGLEGEWHSAEGVNTESLRLAFRRYRTLFERLLAF